MAESQYDVEARLRVAGGAAAASQARVVSRRFLELGNNARRGGVQAGAAVQQLDQRMGSLGRRIRGNSSMAGQLVRQVVGLGVAYLGLSAGVRVFTGLTRGAMSYTAELEKTKIGLTSVLQAVEGYDWGRATQEAEKAFTLLKDMSITSPAGPQEMFGIYQGIVGPMRAAGTEMGRIFDITKNTVLASSALNVDYAQATRDISLMARGAAGMDVKLFSLLRSTGAIREDTEAWNKSLTAAQRVEKIESALKKFSESGEAFGKSWAGVTSTFRGIANELKRAAFQPIMTALAARLGRINTALTVNREQIEATLSIWGNRTAGTLMRVADRLGTVFRYILSHWDQISARVHATLQRAKVLAPTIGKAALGVMVGREVVGGGLSLASGAMQLRQELGFGGGRDRGKSAVKKGVRAAKKPVKAAGAAAAAAAPAVAAGFGQLPKGVKAGSGDIGEMLAGAAAARLQEKQAAAAMAPMLPKRNPWDAVPAGFYGTAMGTPGSATRAGAAAAAGAAGSAAAGGGTGAAAGAAATAMAPLAPILLAAAAATVGLVLVVREQWTNLSSIVSDLGGGMLGDITAILRNSWRSVAPVLKVVGHVVGTVLTGAFTLLVPPIRLLLSGLRLLTEGTATLATTIYNRLRPAIDAVYSFFAGLAAKIRSFLMQLPESIRPNIGEAKDGKAPARDYDASLTLVQRQRMEDLFLRARKRGEAPEAKRDDGRGRGIPAARGGTTVNVKKMVVNQRFSEKHRPDRVVYAMMRDLTRQAESRISSPYTPALTR